MRPGGGRRARVCLEEMVSCVWEQSAGVSVTPQCTPPHSEPCICKDIWTCDLASRNALAYSALDLKLSPLFLSSACGSPRPSFSPSSISLPSTATDDCYQSVHQSTLVSLLKKNTKITTPCGSCTNICYFDSTLFQHSALEGLCEHFLQAASRWESCGTMKTYESPI